MTFKPGISPNPAGRPKGSGAKQKLFMETIWPYASEISEKVREMALEGNESMMKLITERLYPRPQDNMMFLDMHTQINEETLIKASEGVIKMVTSGELLPEEGKAVTEMFKSHRDSMMLQTLMEKLNNLQDKVDGMGK